ncbi:MAG TPA: PASTA domain-containing protein [Gaiellales bacterium]|nr:PASTA domain-containing protein [Gaiellales bacterium]
MSDERIPPEEIPARPVVPVPPDETLVAQPVRSVVREQVVVPPLDAGVVPGAVHEEERVGVATDGSIVREYDRVEQPPIDERRNWWPWIISAVLLLVLIGLGIWYFTRDAKTTVTPVTGQPLTVAVNRLQSDGFKTQIIRRVSGRRPGTVIGEQPAGGSKADKGAVVVLTVAAAPTSVPVPNAVGVAQGVARDRLVAAGFKVKSVAVSSDQPVGTVVAQAPAAGEKTARGTSARINVSKGRATANVPSEVGQTSEVAQQALAAKGFRPTITKVPSDQPTGTVVAQNPSGGQARKGASVQLNVSTGPAATTTTPVTTPTTTTTTAPTTTSTGSGTTTTTG